jgi:hypothetical protein
MEPIYTYDDWYSGEVFLEIERATFPGFVYYEIATLDQFSEKDQFRILTEKIKIGELKVNDILKRLKENCSERYKSAHFKSLFLAKEFDAVKEFLFGETRIESESIDTIWGETYSRFQLKRIRKYIKKKEELKNVPVTDFDFVLPPKREDGMIYNTLALLEYYNFVDLQYQKIKTSSISEFKNENLDYSDPINEFNLVFKNGWSQKLFVEVANEILKIKKKLNPSDLDSLIYILKDKDYGAVHALALRKSVIEAVNILFPEVPFKSTNFNYRTLGSDKVIIFQRVWEKYKDKI